MLSPEYTPGEIYIQSSSYERTVQSAYSELLGLYPTELLTESEKIPSVAMPPFKVRDKDVSHQYFFPTVPVMNFERGNFNDFRTECCDIVAERYEKRI